MNGISSIMDGAAKTSSYPSKDETSPPTSWDPKRFICDHNVDRPLLAGKIVSYSKRQAELEKKMARNEKKTRGHTRIL